MLDKLWLMLGAFELERGARNGEVVARAFAELVDDAVARGAVGLVPLLNGGRAWHNGGPWVCRSGSDRCPRHVRGERGTVADGALVGVARGRLASSCLAGTSRAWSPERGCPRHRQDRPDDPCIRAPSRSASVSASRPSLLSGIPTRSSSPYRCPVAARLVNAGETFGEYLLGSWHGRHRLVPHRNRGWWSRGRMLIGAPGGWHAAPGGGCWGRRGRPSRFLPNVQRILRGGIGFRHRAEQMNTRTARGIFAVVPERSCIPARPSPGNCRRSARLPGRGLASRHRPGSRRREARADPRLARACPRVGWYRAGCGDCSRRAAPYGCLRSSRHPHCRVDRPGWVDEWQVQPLEF